MTTKNWKIQLRWVEADAGVIGNELAVKLAQEAEANNNITESYKRIPKRVLIKELEDDSVKKWQRDWTNSTKGKMKKTSTRMLRRLNMNINLTQNFKPWSQATEKQIHTYTVLK